MPSPRELMAAFVKAMDTLDFDALERLIHPEYVGEYPQSRERFRGYAAFRAQLEQYPEGAPAGSSDTQAMMMIGEEDRWVVTPGYTVVPLAGPNLFTAVLRTRYPDGTYWHVITIIEFRDGLMFRSTTFFAPEYEAPEWRRGLTEQY